MKMHPHRYEGNKVDQPGALGTDGFCKVNLTITAGGGLRRPQPGPGGSFMHAHPSVKTHSHEKM